MTEAELLAAAAAAAKLAAISADEYLRRVSTSQSYDYKHTNWYRALAALEEIKHLPPAPPPPPAAIDLRPAQSWVFMAEEPDKALIYPAHYGIAFTADAAYPQPSASLVSQLRGRGQRLRSWCDCHSTMPSAAAKMAAELGLDGWIGEGESAYAFDGGYAGGAKIMVGNLSALSEDRRPDGGLCWYDALDPAHSRRTIIETGRVLWINELYLNDDPTLAPRENWMNLPVAGRCVACYHGYPFQNYLSLGKFFTYRDSVYDPGATDADRQLVP